MQQCTAKVERIVIVGFGNIGHRHLANCKFLFPDASLYLVSSSGRELPITDPNLVQLSLDQAVALRPDFAIIASPASLHLQHTKAFLQADIPVLLEKPATASTADALALLELAPPDRVSLGYCLRYLPAFAVMQQLLETNKLGQLLHIYAHVGQYLPDWRKNTAYQQSVTASAVLGGGVLLELSHEFDYLQALFGPLQPLSCLTSKVPELSTEVELLADVLLQTQNGIRCFVHLDAVQKADQRFCFIVGSQASVRWDLKKNTVTLSTAEGEQQLFSDPGYDRNSMYLSMLSDFVQRYQTKQPSAVSLASAVQLVLLIDQLKQLANEAT